MTNKPYIFQEFPKCVKLSNGDDAIAQDQAHHDELESAAKPKPKPDAKTMVK